MKRSLSVRFHFALGIATVLALLTAGCQIAPVAPPAPSPAVVAVYTPVAWTELPAWDTDNLEAAWPALLVGCKALTDSARTRAIWQAACAAAATLEQPDARAVRTYFEAHFSAYRITASDGADTGIVSGYYEPLLLGSRTRSEQYTVPLYAPPDDLLIVELADLYPELKGKRVRGRLDGRRVIPYWTRADIDVGNAELIGKALAYVADPVEAFFLEIQGSGRIQLADGAVMRLGYADQNGHPYRSIANVLINRGELTLERASMQAIEAWGREHPQQLPALLEENPSYVFFREVPPPPGGSLEARIDGPIGSLGVPLLAERTIAVDARAIPLGAPVFLATTRPLSAEPLTRLVMAQDTGGAIHGPMRVDFFWGFGAKAGQEAGKMRQQGRVWLLWPKGAALPGSS